LPARIHEGAVDEKPKKRKHLDRLGIECYNTFKTGSCVRLQVPNVCPLVSEYIVESLDVYFQRTVSQLLGRCHHLGRAIDKVEICIPYLVPGGP
jgi:hypothetical protein